MAAEHKLLAVEAILEGIVVLNGKLFIGLQDLVDALRGLSFTALLALEGGFHHVFDVGQFVGAGLRRNDVGDVWDTGWRVLYLDDLGLRVSLHSLVHSKIESKLELALVVSLTLIGGAITLRLQIPLEVTAASISNDLFLARRLLLFGSVQMFLLPLAFLAISLLLLLGLDTAAFIFLSFRNDCL